MIVKPGLEKHPKFLGLARLVGDRGRALLILYRLWEHCEESKWTGFWGAVGADYVEMVCQWNGVRGKLFAALVEPLGPGSKGWVEVGQDGGVTVRGWDEVNAGLISSRINGRHGGRPRKASGSRVGVSGGLTDGKTHGLSGGLTGMKPGENREEKSGEEKSGVPPAPLSLPLSGTEKETAAGVGVEAKIPTAREMFEFFQARGEAVTLRTCENYEKWATRNRLWIRKSGLGEEFVRPWQEEIPEWALQDRTVEAGPGSDKKNVAPSRNGAGGAGQNAREELEEIEATLQWLTPEKDAARHAALVKRRRELKG